MILIQLSSLLFQETKMFLAEKQPDEYYRIEKPHIHAKINF